ncbi:hypothetical protein B0A50_03457 [Salinomyces thailandicus]|uniref:Protein kinase domain-containing protein n=1 Tax=Salinomyces thailandicus TaxID=706561 RepID=A0A4U0U5K6_9PEZI|nr:hypothetical protein B0A50_03457 [Salinomyces thailandica]
MGSNAASHRHLSQTHHELCVLGFGYNGETYLALPKTSLADLPEDLTPENLTPHLIVAKFNHPDVTSHPLASEITVMKQVPPHRHLISHLASHHDGPIQWLTLPFCPGGDLASFIRCRSYVPSISFASHCILQLTHALAFLYFGISNLFPSNPSEEQQPNPNWKPVHHGDLNANNIFLRPAPSADEAYGNFPDLVLADFGRARALPEDPSAYEKHRHLRGSIVDIRDLGGVIVDLCGESRVVREHFGQTGAALEDFDVEGGGEMKFETRVLEQLRRLARTAVVEREERYVALSQEMAMGLSKVRFTEEDIERVLGE